MLLNERSLYSPSPQKASPGPPGYVHSTCIAVSRGSHEVIACRCSGGRFVIENRVASLCRAFLCFLEKKEILSIFECFVDVFSLAFDCLSPSLYRTCPALEVLHEGYFSSLSSGGKLGEKEDMKIEIWKDRCE